jgi:di/tricarboxylate transporter
VIGITRGERTLVAPDPGQRLEAGDQLTAEGSLEEMETLQHWRLLSMPADTVDIGRIYLEGIRTAEVCIPAGSPLVGSTLNRIGFRRRYAANVLALKHAASIRRTGLQDIALAAGDHLLLAGRTADIDALRDSPDVSDWRIVDRGEIVTGYLIQERLQLMQVPADSALVGKNLKQARLGTALGGRILGILRESDAIALPEPGETLRSGDRLLVEGHPVDFDIMRGLERLRIDPSDPPAIESLVTRRYGLMEVILSPHTRLSGKTLRQLNFREKFGLNVLSIWREGRAHYADLRDTALKFGDALLLFGDTRKLQLLGREPDVIVLTASAAEPVNTEKAPVSLAVMAAVLVPVLLGWVPIYIAAVIGAAVMVLSGCLSMEEAYRQIEWKAVFLIAGMLPLGQALDRTGAARLIAEQVANLLGPFGPLAVMAGFVALTFLATCFIPTAALVVLMAPIVLKTSADLNVAPHAMMMAVAMAASASFITPIAHPANIMVMGPGGYRFTDYLKVGGLLTVVVFVVIVGVLPLLWPLLPNP